jgi:hypothetical protein
MKIPKPLIAVGAGFGLYWAWRKMQLAGALQISLDTFVFPDQIKIRFRNAAGAGVTVDAVFLNLYLGSVNLGEINSNGPFYVEGRSQTSVTLKLLITWGTLIQTAGGLIPIITSMMQGGPMPKNLSIRGFISAAGNKMEINQALNGVDASTFDQNAGAPQRILINQSV